MATADTTVDGYADAIVGVATAEGALDRVEDELYRFARIIEANAELGQRLTDPAVDTPTKLGVMQDLLGGRAHPQTVSAIMYVVQSGRARQLPAIAGAVVQRAAASRSRAVADVRTAVPLSDEHQTRLADALTKATGQQVEVKVTVDPEVVGGVVVTVGDTVIDGSVARRLAELRSRLVGA
ncbi:MAG: ATP synthase F1 subunit delta [Actinomycetota bacterium]|nr:ATP synthase F1 subunit delta [Actinomycetota bacterium]